MEDPKKVRVDWFVADVANVEIDLTDDLMTGLIGNAVEYLRANGAITWEKWSLLSSASRAAFSAAASQLKARESMDIPS